MFGSSQKPEVIDVQKAEQPTSSGTRLKVVVKLPGCTIRIQGWRVTVSR